jgi:hypothetical protein
VASEEAPSPESSLVLKADHPACRPHHRSVEVDQVAVVYRISLSAAYAMGIVTNRAWRSLFYDMQPMVPEAGI